MRACSNTGRVLLNQKHAGPRAAHTTLKSSAGKPLKKDRQVAEVAHTQPLTQAWNPH
jgi:hypothetical protein